jgi:hypothetical protein
MTSLHALTKPNLGNFVYQTTDSPFKISYKKWTERWWQWLVGIRYDANPANDSSGSFAGNNQLYNEVFFLAGAVNRKAKREVTIPENKAILFPILTTEYSEVEKPGSPLDDLQKFCQHDNDDMISLEVAINRGTKNEIMLWTGELYKYRIFSDEFDLDMVQDNLFTRQGGKYKAAADGYWCFIKENSLPKGDNTLWFRGIAEYYQTEVEYLLHVQ